MLNLNLTLNVMSMTHLFCSWKSVTFDLPHLFLSPFQSIPSSNHLFILCIYYCVSVFFFFFILVHLFLFFKIPHISKSIKYLSFFIWFISLSIIPSRSIHVVANGKISFFLWITLYMYSRSSLCTHWLVGT